MDEIYDDTYKGSSEVQVSEAVQGQSFVGATCEEVFEGVTQKELLCRRLQREGGLSFKRPPFRANRFKRHEKYTNVYTFRQTYTNVYKYILSIVAHKRSCTVEGLGRPPGSAPLEGLRLFSHSSVFQLRRCVQRVGARGH